MYKNDLFDRLKLSEFALLGCATPDKLYLPTGYEEAHNLGRWWDAALVAEDVIGTEIPKQTEKAMHLNIRALMSNRYGLLLMDPEVYGRGVLNLHNLREALLTLTALVKYRNSQWARERGHRLLQTIDDLFFTGKLTQEQICDELGTVISDDPMLIRPLDDPYRTEDDTPTTGRALEGMILFYQATGDPLALRMVHKTAAYHFKKALRPDGSTPEFLLTQEHVGHNHSYLGTLRGLLLYGITFHKPAYVGAVRRTYQNSIYRVNCSLSGYAPHDLAKSRFCDDKFGDPTGDHASCADVAYIAFLLGVYDGQTELFDDAERLIRARLFRSQITEGEGDKKGSWGCYWGYFGKDTTQDVYASIISTLCLIYRETSVEDDQGLTVRLHFSTETEGAIIRTERTAKAQHVSVTLKREQAIRIRIPRWCDRRTARLLREDGTACPFTVKGMYATVACGEVAPQETVRLTFTLPETVTEETTWISGHTYRIHWLGDEIIDTELLPKE